MTDQGGKNASAEVATVMIAIMRVRAGRRPRWSERLPTTIAPISRAMNDDAKLAKVAASAMRPPPGKNVRARIVENAP
jgi:hypothetical protein